MSASASPTTWTIKSLLAWTAKYLTEKGIESPRLEAELLLAHALQCKRIDLIVRYDEEPGEAARAAFRELVRRRAERWPTAYLIGTREFFLLRFEVTPAVLIPRPETETLVLAALEAVKDRPAPRILDLGTGSGCIAVSLAVKLPAARAVAIDISPDALDVARANAARHGVAERIEFRPGDLFKPVAGETFDLIVSNPPYISTSELAGLQEEVRDHEPRHALDGGTDGLAFYRRIAAEAPAHLAAGGTAAVEVGWQQAEAVRGIFAAAGWGTVSSIKDAGGIARVIVARDYQQRGTP